jgi:hypothetical protein
MPLSLTLPLRPPTPPTCLAPFSSLSPNPAPQAIAGLIAQLRTNQSLQVWDHGILMRERMIYLDCFKRNLLPHFVNEQLVRLHRAAAMVLYRLTDLVVPCNASFNTLWELWLGTDRHRLMPLLNALEIEHYPSLQVGGGGQVGGLGLEQQGTGDIGSSMCASWMMCSHS